ncbi:MAG TPA: hypothetical protein VNJ03_17600 [Vicinamibacterales bacterium]|nr:hypothetical protein [Vicinamibacterales bacterium]
MFLSKILFVLGVGFLAANLRLMVQFIRFVRLRHSAIVTWPSRRPRHYPLLLALGAVLSVLIAYKLAVLHWHPKDVFGETMMLLYYGYSVPLSLRIGRGFYQNGIWADAGYVAYSSIGGMSWREGEPLTLVLVDRLRDFGRRLTVPERYYGAARRVLHDKIAAHDIHFTGKALDLGAHDERDDV